MKTILRILAFALVVSAAIPKQARAEGSPGLVFGQVPTAAQWNSYFAAKQDYLGFTPINPANLVATAPIAISPSGGVYTWSLTPCAVTGSFYAWSGAAWACTTYGTRTLLTTATSYYVNPASGNDANACTSLAPCATLNHIRDLVCRSIDIGGQTLTIQMVSNAGATNTFAPMIWNCGTVGGGRIVFQGATLAVTGIANNGSGKCRVTVASTTGLTTGDIRAVIGATKAAGAVHEANGSWSITVVDATHFDMTACTFANAWVSGGGVVGSALLSSTSGPAVNFTVPLTTSFGFNGIRFTTSGSGSNAIQNSGSSNFVDFANIDMGPVVANHFALQNYATTYQSGPYVISGNAAMHVINTKGTFLATGQVYISNALAITYFCYTTILGVSQFVAVTFNYQGGTPATVTGQRYVVDTNSIIATGGGGAAFLPGTIAGTTNSGGIYQ